MPIAQTSYFGTISYTDEAAIEFPRGLPGFDDLRRFVALQFRDTAPLVFIQSLQRPDLCFIAMPALAIDPQYRLQVNSEDLEEVGLPPSRQPRIGSDVLCLSLISLDENGPTANLLAPIVVNLRNLKAVQAVAPDSGYSHQHPLCPMGLADGVADESTEEVAVCS